ncbi:MAG: diguanylate cyclase [Chloroflexia bacterium]|nr:diguanylate cyclase [Chloroflexia bacterium]
MDRVASRFKDLTSQCVSLFAGLHIGSIRNRLLIASMLLVLLPMFLIGSSSVLLGLRGGQTQVINQLESVATLKEEQILAWIQSLRIHMGSIVYPHQVPRLIEPLLTYEPGSPAYTEAYNELRIQFDGVVASTGLFEEVLLLNPQGRTLVATDPAKEGQVHSLQEYFWRGIEGTYVQSLSSATAQGLSSPVVVSQPIYDLQGRARGVLVGRASAQTLNEIMLQRAGLGETGETYLVGPNYLLLTDSRFADRRTQILRLHTPIMEQVIGNQSSASGIYDNYRQQRVIGVYHWLPSLQFVLVAEQEEREAFQTIYATLRLNMVIALTAVLFALLSALFVARSIASPLASLADTATRIAAGDLQLIAHPRRNDEIGALTVAFNRMTARLRELIGNLESHVSVLEQTEAEVRRVNQQLARDIKEQELLSRLSSRLQQSQSLEEAYAVSMPLLETIFKGYGGALYHQMTEDERYHLIGVWGHQPDTPPGQLVSQCPAMQADTRFIYLSDERANHACADCLPISGQPLLCVQLHANREPTGMLCLYGEPGSGNVEEPRELSLAIRTADLLALALANLQLREDLREQAIRDPLTGLFNRRFVNEILGPKLIEARRHQRTLGIMLLDIDYFKHINDTFGHDAGDTTLRILGRFLSTSLRGEDIACRFGGEEMLLIMPGMTEENALSRANNLREAISNLDLVHEGQHLPNITTSIGVAIFPDHGRTHDELVTAADQALYRAKSEGRNRVYLAQAREITI